MMSHAAWVKSTKIYSILIFKVQNKAFSNICFVMFHHNDIDWTAIYKLPRLAAHDTYIRFFQHKI